MRFGTTSLACLCLMLSFAVRVRAEEKVTAVLADPSEVRLTGPRAVYSLLIHGKTADGRLIDLTHAAQYGTADPKVAVVSDSGVIRAVADGATTVEVEAAGRKVSVAVAVKGAKEPRPINFENDIIPLFGRFGCNSSGCHGKAEGQNGFKLSVFGFDPAADYAALVKEGAAGASSRRRRTPACCWPRCPARAARRRRSHPAQQLPITRPSASWIAAGLPFGRADDPKVASRARRAVRTAAGHARLAATPRHRPLHRRPRSRCDRPRPVPVEQRRPGLRQRRPAWSAPATCPARRRSWPVT